MFFVKILLGLFGLGIVVFVHELGHFLAARLVGIDVEAFSIGWGNPVLKKKVGTVEYRLGMFPIGGYCKMRGDNEFNEAWETNAKGIAPEKGTFFGTSPLRRILACFAGPLFNLVFAILVLSVIWGIGFNVQTLDNKIILASEMDGGNTFPADEAGFKTGDRIIAVNGVKTGYFHEVQENIAVNADRLLKITVDRQGEIITLQVKPDLDKNTGAGKIGVYFWTDPEIAQIVSGSDAAIAGLMPKDRITSVNGELIANTIDFVKALGAYNSPATVCFIRNGMESCTTLVPSRQQDKDSPAPAGAGLGIIWPRIQYHTPPLSLPAALAKGTTESWKTLTVSLRSLSLLFKGIKLTEAVSGPVRITYMVGDIATEGFGQSFGAGIRSMADFLALISIALCVMNLLPLPVLDGGMILLFIAEMIRRKPLHPKIIKVFQAVGVVLIAALMIFALFGDILYLSRR